MEGFLALTGMIAVIAYAFTIFWLITGWCKSKPFFPPEKKCSTSISLIIPARNEEDNIGQCLQAIEHQTYPLHLLEVIIIDDDSDDMTRALIRKHIKESKQNIKLIELNGGIAHGGKKRAIRKGIEASSGKLIVTTDADSIMGAEWIQTIALFYEQHACKMIIAPVMMQAGRRFFSMLQALEFAGLSLTAAGSALNKNPVLANACNLAYEKDAYEKVGGFVNNMQLASGDDVLLMQEFQQRWRGCVQYLKSKEAVVWTKPERSVQAFIHQRIRWAGKASRMVKDRATLAIGMSFSLLNISLLMSAVFSIIKPDFVEYFFLQLVFKGLIDFLFLLLAVSFFQKKDLLVIFLPALLMEIIYSTCILIWSSVFREYHWKGRKTR